jgi:hypothetical protein
MPDIRQLTVRVVLDGCQRTFHGRLAWALAALIDAGEKGCTPIDHPGLRWPAYVHKLHREGLSIETVTERHAAPYAGTHARYVLRSFVEAVSVTPLGKAA